MVNVTLSAPGVLQALDFNFIPWGNAYYSAVTGNTSYDRGPGMTAWIQTCGMGVSNPPSKCFSGDILCQHGPNECKGNLIEGCVKKVVNNVAADYWPWVSCFEGSNIDRVNPSSPLKAMKACSTKFHWTASQQSKLESCINTPESAHEISSSNAKTTAALVPAHQGTPWILLNGKPYDITTPSANLLKAVCNLLPRPKPAGCR